jgi:hypothetical protein
VSACGLRRQRRRVDSVLHLRRLSRPSLHSHCIVCMIGASCLSPPSPFSLLPSPFSLFVSSLPTLARFLHPLVRFVIIDRSNNHTYMHFVSCTLYPAPCTLRPAPCGLRHAACCCCPVILTWASLYACEQSSMCAFIDTCDVIHSVCVAIACVRSSTHECVCACGVAAFQIVLI